MRSQIDRLIEVFEKNKRRECIFDLTVSQSLTYADVEKLSLRLAAFLEQKAIQKGDKVGIILPNCWEHVVIYFALMHLGAVAVPVNAGLHNLEIDHLMKQSGVKLSFVSITFQERLKDVVHPSADSQVIYLSLTEHQQANNVLPEAHTLDELTQQKDAKIKPFARVTDDDPTAIMYTSGTTSYPKGVVICYRNVISNGLKFVEVLGIPVGLKFLGVFSLAYMGGWYNLLLIPILSQGTVVLDQTFGSSTALNFWEKVTAHKITALWLTPTMMSLLLFTGKVKDALSYCQNNIRHAFVGTAPLPPKLKRDFEKHCGIRFYENYGLSETFFIATNSPAVPSKEGSVGKVIEGCEVQVRQEDGTCCPTGKEGEIFVLTQYLMNGYYKETDWKKLIDPKGFFATGDMGYLDAEGHLYITGRKKDLIIRGGLNISPKSVEDKMMEMEGVQEVACIGVPHNIYGEEVAVVVKLKPQHKGLLSEKDVVFYATQHFAQAKYPRLVYFIDEFPRSSSGKIQKNKLRSMVQEKNPG